MNEKKNTVLMTEGGIFKNLLFFATPLILGNLLQQMYNAVDSIIVGNYVGSNALAAVGAGASLIYLLIAFSLGASVGAGVIVSQYLGAKDKEGVHKAVHTALAISIILGLILTAGGILFSRKLLVMMNTPAEILDDAACYLRIYSYGLIFNVVYNMAAGILNAAGNSRRSLMYLAAAAVVNIFMDLLLIAGLKIGVAGAAIATNFSQAISCILALWFLFRVPADYRISLKSLRIHKAMALRIIQIGLPTGIQNMVISFSNILIQASINQYGATAVAGFSAYLKIDGFNILPVLSFSMAITTFIGQNYGAGKYDRMKKGMWVTLLMGIVYTVLTGILLLTFSGQIMRLFSEDVGVIAYGQTAMRYFCPFYWILAILHSLAGTVRGTGKSIPPMVVLLVSLCLFRIVWIQLVLPYYTSIEGIFILYPVSWLVGAVLMILYTWKGKRIEL
ncbi:MATE family efflux transporter [Clostridiaceae bacterium Marseille-Q4145]|nr:MATE family efflux transporter [Clostridiaceae bacterium Marseille-Q4145]